MSFTKYNRNNCKTMLHYSLSFYYNQLKVLGVYRATPPHLPNTHTYCKRPTAYLNFKDFESPDPGRIYNLLGSIQI